jgi:hypothetical protein
MRAAETIRRQIRKNYEYDDTISDDYHDRNNSNNNNNKINL